jgi:hypothetical protein
MGQNAQGYHDGLGTGVCPPGATGISPGAPAIGRTPYRTAGAPTTEFNGIAPKYAIAIRTDTGVYHMNTGTLAANTWTVITLTP